MNEPGKETSTGPKGFYYDRLRVPNGDYSSNPLSPSGKMSLKGELIKKQHHLTSKSSRNLSIYLAASQKPSLAAEKSLGRSSPADVTKILTDRQAQDLNEDCGTRRSMQTNTADFGMHINTNILRFNKHQGYTNTLPLDGGWRYSPSACTGNFVEERRERGYASGFHARELRLSKIYMTEYSNKFRPTSEKYYNRIAEANTTAKFPKTIAGKVPNLNDCDGHNLYYCTEGFGDKAWGMDHTIPPHRGGYWCGTAPVKKNETISKTVAQGGLLEFQQRNSVFDHKAKILSASSNCSAAQIQNVMKGLAESGRFTSTWKSSYNMDFKDTTRQTISAQTQRVPPKELGSTRPITASACSNSV